jgi:MYXO-CTERM domain-containing protein
MLTERDTFQKQLSCRFSRTATAKAGEGRRGRVNLVAYRLGVAVSSVVLLGTAPAFATYSIVGADTATREVGGTGTSCLNGSDVYIIYGAAPGFGVIHAQASANQNGRNRGVELLEQGTAPADIISEITSQGFDGNARVRQYGIADSSGRTAGFTGTGDQAFADDRQGSAGTFSYSVQGNILTSEAVLTQAAAAFEASGCDLAERLMRALEAGADNGEGDSRCTPDGIPSDSSFIQVERPGTARGSYLELHVRSSGNDSPIPGLREQFDAWRATHPCPSPGGGSGGGSGAGGASGSGATSGSGGTSGASPATGGAGGTAGAASGGRASGGAPPSGASGGGTPGSGSPGAGTSGAAGSSSSKPASDDGGGCGCRAGGQPKPWALVGLASLVGLAIRRRLVRRQRSSDPSND